jgi:hypothetical protein
MQLKIKLKDVKESNSFSSPSFPKYTSQLMNLANQNSQGTRPKVVGQLSALFPEYQSSSNDPKTIPNWEKWYLDKCPDAIDTATEKTWKLVQELQKAIMLIDENLVRTWIKDLVINKTFSGLYVQKVVLETLGAKLNKPYRLATPEEESKGIDGFVGDIAYSVKPDTYKTMDRLSEVISVKMIYYTKTDTEFIFEIEE